MNQKIELIYFLNDTGDKNFVFLNISAEKLFELNKKILLKQKINFEDYGAILLTGKNEPDESIFDYMFHEYGYKK